MTQAVDFLASQAPAPAPVNYGEFTFTVKQPVLASLCSSAAHALPVREQVPILGSFAIKLGAGLLGVTAASGEQFITAVTTAFTAADKDEHAVFIPARKLLAILKEAPAADLVIAVAGNEARITATTSQWVLKLPDGAGYPELPSLAAAEFSPYSRQKLLTAVKAVKHAVCKDAGQPSLTQVQISGGEKSVVTASDRTRLARTPLDGFPVAVTIPVAVLDDLLRVLGEHPDDAISVGEVPTHLVVIAGHVSLAIAKRSAQYQFPDMDKQLLEPAQKANTAKFTVDKDNLAQAVRRVAIAADTQTSAIALRLDAKAVTVEARDKNGNSATETLLASWTDAPRTVVVNHQFLLEMLAASTAPSCEFRLGPDNGKRLSPLLLAGGDGEVQVLTRMPAALLGYG